MADIPPEIITDILTRLPAKSLLRFRSVSKLWRSLIDSPNFIKNQLTQSLKTHTNLNLILRCTYLYSVDLDSPDFTATKLNHPSDPSDEGTGIEIVGSCNGLICLYNIEEDLILWNPNTKKLHKLPSTEIEFPDNAWICQFIVYGFGYDSVTDDYKVVRLMQFYGEGDSDFESKGKVYSLKSNSWRKIGENPYYLKYKRGYGMLVGGVLHWVVSENYEVSDTQNLILGFDLGTEEYSLVSPPEYSKPDYSECGFHINVGVLRGCLVVTCNHWGDRIEAWVMKEYGVVESWTKLFCIGQPGVISSFEFLHPLEYSKDGSEILLLQDGKKFLLYDLNEESVKNVNIHGLRQGTFETEIVVGSLVTLNGVGLIDVERPQPAQEKKKKMNQKKRDDFLSKGFKLQL